MSLKGGGWRHLIATALLLCLLAPATSEALPDERGWEMVSPVDKNGGGIAFRQAIADGGALQAAADGESVTYGSTASFGTDAQGAPPASQYISKRSASGWSTQNISQPLLSGSYDTEAGGAPYRVFSTDLARALHLDPRRCIEGDPCLKRYSLRDNATGALTPSVEEEDLLFAGASADLSQVVLSTCAALTANATEVPLGPGCDPAKPNLYRWSSSGLSLVNLLPAQSTGTPGASLGAQSTAISADGSRVYWSDTATGNLYLREGNATRQVDTAAGGGGSFQTATADGAVAFFTKAGHVYRYLAATNTATDITPGGGVSGVLGVSADGSHAYFQDAGALKLWKSGVTSTVAPGASAAAPSNYPPTTGTSRVSADGARLLFLSKASLTGYDNTDQKTLQPDTEAFLYEADKDELRCVSCRPNTTRPIASTSIPGSVPNGSSPGSPNLYRPRALSEDGRRVFFETADVLVGSDTNNDLDVYQWEAKGTGSCTKAAGCIDLISSGRAEGGAVFLDASADGADAFFITDGSLASQDPGGFDLYVARVGGGFPDPPVAIPCIGDACQSLPSEPIDPGLSSLFAGPGNPPVRYVKSRTRCPKGSKRVKGKCRHQKGAKGKGSKKRGGR